MVVALALKDGALALDLKVVAMALALALRSGGFRTPRTPRPGGPPIFRGPRILMQKFFHVDTHNAMQT